MDYEFSDEFDKKYNSLRNVRLKKAIDKTIDTFSKNPHNSVLENHPLERELEGLQSIHVIGYRTNDYCAIYKEMTEENGTTYAYFLLFGTHKELFR